LANLHKKAGRLKEEAAGYESALRCYSRLLALSPDDPSYQIPPIGVRCDLARVLAAAGQPAEAKRAREEAAELYEQLAPRIVGQAALSRSLRAEFDHQGIRVFLGLGRPREAAGAAERAVALYELLMAESPDFQAFRWRAAVSSHLLGRARIALGRHDAAIETYRKAVALRPDRALFNNDLAWMLVTAPEPGSHNPREAVRLATRATELDPPAANVWNTLGVARYRAGNYRDAIQALDKAEELGRGREFGFNATFLAMARWQLGEREEARRLYDRAVEWMTKNKPDDDELRQFLAEARVSLQIKVREP
jgi:tetratricopeptide (TPR) repeat protein